MSLDPTLPRVRRGRFSPRGLIVAAIDDYVTRMGDRDISVISDIHYSVPGTISGDGAGLRHLIDSVLDDAGRSVDKGRIHIECRFDNGSPDCALVFTIRLTRLGTSSRPAGRDARGNFFSARIPVVHP